MMSVPMWHANYADDKGHIMFVFDGLVPRRNGHDYDYWSGVVPGDTSETLWTDYLSFDELPKSIDPPSRLDTRTRTSRRGTMTLPLLDRTKYAPYVAPTGEALPQMRTLRSRRMITEDPKISYEQLIAKKHSTRMELADRVLPDLLKAANGGTEAARVLEKWDRMTDADSRGAVLFQLFVDRYFSGPGGIAAKLRVKFDPARPLDSAYGLNDPASALAALAAAAEECRELYGALDVKWGDVFRFASGNADLPGNGGPGGSGLFRTIAFTRKVGNRYYAANGETIVCAIEFGPSQQARCTLGYGNATQAGFAASRGSVAADGAEDASSGVAGEEGDRSEPGEARELLTFTAGGEPVSRRCLGFPGREFKKGYRREGGKESLQVPVQSLRR